MVTLLDPAPRSRAGMFELREAGQCHWLLHDNSYAPSDARHVVASLHQTRDRDIEVVWLRVDFPARTRFHTLAEVLHCAASTRYQAPSRQKPVEIPHHRPLAP